MNHHILKSHVHASFRTTTKRNVNSFHHSSILCSSSHPVLPSGTTKPAPFSEPICSHPALLLPCLTLFHPIPFPSTPPGSPPPYLRQQASAFPSASWKLTTECAAGASYTTGTDCFMAVNARRRDKPTVPSSYRTGPLESLCQSSIVVDTIRLDG